MSENSKIEWTDHTFNPWIGCAKVSAGCTNCYAETRDKRHLIEPVDHWGKGAPRLRTSAANWRKPLQWNRTPMICNECGAAYSLAQFHSDDPLTPMCSCMSACHRARVFCASLADWLDDEVPIEWLADLLALIHATPNLDWQLLTKRPEMWLPRLCAVFEFTGQSRSHFVKWEGAHLLCEGWLSEGAATRAPANVWLGVSVENQPAADDRVPKILQIPAAIRFLSCEPLLGEINFVNAVWPQVDRNHGLPMVAHAMDYLRQIHWVIIGCESEGKKAGRNAEDYEWQARRIIARCSLPSSVSRFHKQMPVKDRVSHDPDEWPDELRVREFPSVSSAPAERATTGAI